MKAVQEATGTITSIVKAVPLIVGAAGGLVVPARGSTESPLKQLQNGYTQAAFNSMVANYTFFSPEGGEFEASQGRGVKMAIGGAIVHKIMGKLF